MGLECYHCRDRVVKGRDDLYVECRGLSSFG